MSQGGHGSRRIGPPHKPELRGLISQKRKWAHPPQPDQIRIGYRGWYERGYLPHRDVPGLVQFVTFRLADSFPRSLRTEWKSLLAIEDNLQRRIELERYLDKGRGQSWLGRPDVARLTEEVILHFHSERYELGAWVVMPNHVHALFKTTSFPMADVIESWKKFSSREANRRLGRHGTFWAADYWDTYMRNEDQCRKAIRYIENNPVKVELAREPSQWPFSSARFRDAYGNLDLGVGPNRAASQPEGKE